MLREIKQVPLPGMALAINPTLSVDPTLSRPLPNSPHTPACQTPLSFVTRTGHALGSLSTFAPAVPSSKPVGVGEAFLPYPSSDFLPTSGNISKAHALHEDLSHGPFQSAAVGFH